MSDNRTDLPSTSANNFEQRVRETLMTYMGRQGDPLDRGVTVRDLLSSGLAAVEDGATIQTGARRLPIKPRVTSGAEERVKDLTPPPVPSGFKVQPGISFITIEHDPALFTMGGGYLRTVLYGKVRTPNGDLPLFANAVKVAEFTGSVYSFPSDPATTWHLWIKWETADGVLSIDPAGGTNGLSATTGQDVSKLLDALSGQITASQLNQELGNKVDSISSIEVKAQTTEDTLGTVTSQYFVKVDAGGRVAGFGLASDSGAGSAFAVRANRFYIAPPEGATGSVTSTIPFVVQTTPTNIDGVAVPAGVYMSDALIKNGTITNAKIANAAIDDAKISNLSATKLTAGDGTIGNTLKSESYTSTDGWLLQRNGNAVFNNATIRGTVYATNGQFSGEVIAPADNGEMARMHSGNFEIYKNVPNVGVVMYKALTRMEVGVGTNGVRVTIPGYFTSQPKVIVSPANIQLYNKDYAGQNQTLQCQAVSVTESSAGSMVWGFTPRATLSLAASTGQAVITQDSGTISSSWYTAEYVTPPNVSGISPTVTVGTNRGNGVSQYYYRTVRWRLEYFDGSSWITSLALNTINFGATTTGTISASAPYVLPYANAWRFRIYFEAYDTDGSVFGSGAYSYQNFTASNTGYAAATTESYDPVLNTYNTTPSNTLSVSNPVPAGWEVTGGTMTYSYSGEITATNFSSGAFITAPNLQLSKGSANSNGLSQTYPSGIVQYSTTSPVIPFSVSKTGNAWARVTISNATLTLSARKAVTNSTTANNSFSFQSYVYTLPTAQVLASGTLNWIAVGD